MRPLLCLTGIYLDESHTIKATLDSVKDYIDCWCILDTGSTDGTQAIIRETLASIPGALYEEPFVDFATSRNRALEIHDHSENSAVFTLSLSADEVLENPKVLREFLEIHRVTDGYDTKNGSSDGGGGGGGGGDSRGGGGGYAVEMQSGVHRWNYPRVLRTDEKFRYVGKIHEIPLGPDGNLVGYDIIPGVRIVHTPTDPERRFRRIRDFDIPTLREIVNDESVSLDDRSQSIFFLAQSLETVAEKMPENEPGSIKLSYQLEAMAFYARYAQIAEDPRQRKHDPLKSNFAWFRYLNIANQAGIYRSAELKERLLAVASVEPKIPEACYLLAVHAAILDARQGLYYAEQAVETARKAIENPSVHVPTDSRVEWLALRLAAECAEVTGRRMLSQKLAERGIAIGGPKEEFVTYLENKNDENGSVASER